MPKFIQWRFNPSLWSIYTHTEPEDHGLQEAAVTLICAVTDRLRRGHLVSIYSCPVLVYQFAPVNAMTASRLDDQMSSQAWRDAGHHQTVETKLISSPGLHWTLLLPKGELSGLHLLCLLAHAVFLTLFKELNLICPRCVAVCEKSGPHQTPPSFALITDH